MSKMKVIPVFFANGTHGIFDQSKGPTSCLMKTYEISHSIEINSKFQLKGTPLT